MFGLLKKAASAVGLSSARADFAKHVPFYASASDSEAGMLLANAMLVREFLMTTDSLGGTFPADAVNDGAAVDQAALARYLMALATKARECMSSDRPGIEMMGNGMMTWVLTLRGYAYPELIPYARQLWNEMSRGARDAFDYIEAVRPEWDQDEVMRIMAPPPFLLPNGYWGA